MLFREKGTMFFLFLMILIGYGIFAITLPVTNPVESNYALTAKEMLRDHAFISPMIFGHPWYDKPPITYWMLMASYHIFGFTNFASRLPALITSALTVVAIFAATTVLTQNRRKGLWSAFILSTCFQFWYIGHAVITDGYLLLFSLGIFTFSYLAFERKSRNYMRLAYIAAGLAVLTKGPVGIVLPGLVLLIYVCIRKDKNNWSILFDPIGILLFAATCVPWYYAMYKIHGMAFIKGFLGLHNVTRATVSEHPQQDVWYYYLALTPAYLLPWTFFTIKGAWRNCKEDPLRQFQFLWAGIVILFYTLVATKYITYTYIALIPFIMITAEGVVNFIDQPSQKSWRNSLYVLPLLLLAVALMVASRLEPHIRPISWFMMTVGTLAIIAILFTLLRIKTNKYPAMIALTMGMILISLPITIQPLMEIRSADILSKQVAMYKPDEIYYYYDYDSSYPFYTERSPIKLVDPINYPPNVWSEGKNVMPHENIYFKAEQMPTSEKMIVIVNDKRLKEFNKTPLADKLQIVGRYDRLLIFSNYDVNKKSTLKATKRKQQTH